MKIHVSVCSDNVVIETPADVNNITYVDEYGVHAARGNNLLFKVRAKSDAHIALTRYCSQFLRQCCPVFTLVMV